VKIKGEVGKSSYGTVQENFWLMDLLLAGNDNVLISV